MKGEAGSPVAGLEPVEKVLTAMIRVVSSVAAMIRVGSSVAGLTRRLTGLVPRV